VAEVNAGLEELPHGDGGHGDGPPVRLFLRGPCSGTGRRFRGPAPTRKRGLAPRVISPAMFSARRQSPGDPAAGAESTTGSGPGRVAALVGSGRGCHRATCDQPIPRWWRTCAGPPGGDGGSRTTRSRRIGRSGRTVPSGSLPASSNRPTPARRWASLR